MAVANTKSKDCATLLLSDEPAEADKFGSHEQLAEAIAELIEHEDGGRAAALTGSWGSGKSTTIRLLKAKLNGKANVFVFNAWSHQGDPLRRTFLEQLIDFVTTCGWLTDQNQWEDIKKDIARRRRIQDVTSTPTLSRDGKILAVLLLLTPAGLAMFSRLGEVDHWIAFSGALLSLAPAAYVFAVFLYRKATGRKTDIFEILLKESTTTTKSETIETPDPTSIEFQTCFKRLLSECLNKPGRKLLIVVDNLDRIDAHNALALWSTMSTFFDFGAPSDCNWLKSLWLIVPFDPSALARLWPDAMKVGTGVTSAEDSDDLARVFVDKTFATTFHVPPPVRSDWRSYLVEQLGKAFPEHEERIPDDFHRVYRIYRLGGLSEDRSPTPREIKVFVNNLGAIHRQRKDEIALPLQAFYVVLSTKTWDLEEKLRRASDEDILGSIPIGLVGTDWRTALAAIYFNAPLKKALQLLLGGPAERALLSGDPEKLKEFEDIFGITQVIEDIIGDNSPEWANSDAPSLALAARALSNSGVAEDSSLTECWRMICEATSRVKSWSQLRVAVGEGIVEILQHHKHEDLAKNIVASLAKSSPGKSLADVSLDVTAIGPWLAAVLKVLTAIQAEFPNALQGFSVPGSAVGYVLVMSELAKNLGLDGVASYFVPSVAPKDVIDELIKASNEETFDEGSANAIRSMLLTKREWQWTKLVEQLKGRLDAVNTLNVSEVKASLFTLLRLRQSQPAAVRALTFLAQQGHLEHQLYQCNQAKDEKAVALCMLPIMETIPDGTPLASPGNASNGESIYTEFIGNPTSRTELITELAGIISNFGKTQTLVDLAKRNETKALARETLRQLASEPNPEKRIGSKVIIDHYEVLQAILEGSLLDQLIKRSVTEASLVDDLIKVGFKTTLSDLYQAILRSDEENSTLLEFLESGLRSLDKETWVSELESESRLIPLVIKLVRSARVLDLGIPFQDALHSHAKDLLEGKVEIESLNAEWPELTGALSGSSQETFLQRISELLYSEHSTQSLLEVYGDQLLSEAVLSENAERLALSAFPGFLSRGSLMELNWISRALQMKVDLLNQVKSSTKKDFAGRVSEAYKENQENEEVRKKIEEIADLAKIELARLNEEKKEKEE